MKGATAAREPGAASSSAPRVERERGVVDDSRRQRKQSPARFLPASFGEVSLLLRVWLVVLPITSVVLVPQVQGTTPANLLALLALMPVFDRLFVEPQSTRFRYRVLMCVLVLLISIAASQLALSMSELTPIDFATVQMASTSSGFYLRTSLLTQSAYLVVGFVTFSFFWTHYRSDWDRFLLFGAVILATFGFFEVTYSAVTGRSGDLLSNRSFMDGTFSGSLVQFHSLLGLPMMRLKSLTGEPSMYAITMLPFVMLAIHRGRVWVAVILAASMLLSVSTTAYLGLAMVAAFSCALYVRKRHGAVMLQVYLAVTLATVLLLLFHEQILDLIHRIVISKFSVESDSGAIRNLQAASAYRLWAEGTPLTQLFGVGFGFVRSPDLATTLLVNVGAFGLVAWCILYCAPLTLHLLRRDPDSWAAWTSAFVVALMLLAVPEFAYPITWAFLGIAYRVAHQAQESQRGKA